jgi:gliding motility-associated-like protein
MSFILGCVSTTVQLTAITTDTDVAYLWTTNGSLSGTTISNPVATGSGTYNVIVTNTLTGCQANQTATVTQNTTPPTLTLSPMSFTLGCVSSTVQLTAITTDTDVAYSWTTDGSLSSTTISNPVATGSGTYNVIVTNTVTGCQANQTATVTTNITPPTLTLSPMSFVLTCASPTAQLTAITTDTDVAYSWTTNGSLSNATISNPIATGSGTYNVIVTNTLTGCQANQTTTLTSNTTPPSVSVTNTVIPCGSPSVAIGASSTSTNVSYNWTTSGTGSILSVANLSTAVAGSAGQYVVTVKDNNNGCTNTGTVSVTSLGVTAAFAANPLSGTAPLLVNFTNQSTGASNYSWTFADNNNNTSTLTNPVHTFNTTGNYVVTLIATDASGLCSATATISIEVIESSSIIIPNVFTPNGDGSNDLFKITSTGMKNLTCDIFNRWGTKLYTIKSVNDSWDGSGASDGTYFFILQATGFDGKDFKQQGYLSLFR